MKKGKELNRRKVESEGKKRKGEKDRKEII